MAKLVSVHPADYGGQSAHWDSEPTDDQKASYVENSWPVGATYPLDEQWGWQETGGGHVQREVVVSGILWGLATVLSCVLLVFAVCFGAWVAAR